MAARPAKDTTNKMLGITSKASIARNSLSAIQFQEAVMKSSVSESIIEEDIFEDEVEFIDLEKDIDPHFILRINQMSSNLTN